MMPRLITRLFGASPKPASGLHPSRTTERAQNDSRFVARESRFTMSEMRMTVGESSFGATDSQLSADDRYAFKAEVPPLDIRGLLSIEERSDAAAPHRLRAWITEITDQLPRMERVDRGYAKDLVLKLRYLLDHHASTGRI